MLLATKKGMGIFTDSTLYIMTARNLINHAALAETTPDGKLIPVDYAPPLLPASLMVLGHFGLDPLPGMRWINSLLFGANVFLTGLFIEMFNPCALWIIICGLLITACSPVMLVTHSLAMAEPLFIFLSLLTVFSLIKYLKDYQLGYILAASLAASCASLTKYAGITLIPCGIAVILLLNKQPRRKRFLHAMIYGITALLPVACWITRNLLISGSVIGYEISFNPIKLTDAISLFSIITSWFKFGNILKISPFIIVLSLFAAGGILKVTMKYKNGNPSLIPNKNTNIDDSSIPLLMGIFALFYLLFLAAAKIFFAAGAEPCERYFSPLYIPISIIVFYLINKLYRSFGNIILLKLVLLWISFYITAGCLFTAGTWITSFQGDGYASKKWKCAAIIKEINKLPADAVIASNKEDAIYMLSGRVAWPLPLKIKYNTYGLNEEYPAQLDGLKRNLKKTSEGFIVYFYLDNWQGENLLSEKELKEHLPLRLFWKGNEGVIYKIENKRPAD